MPNNDTYQKIIDAGIHVTDYSETHGSDEIATFNISGFLGDPETGRPYVGEPREHHAIIDDIIQPPRILRGSRGWVKELDGPKLSYDWYFLFSGVGMIGMLLGLLYCKGLLP